MLFIMMLSVSHISYFVMRRSACHYCAEVLEGALKLVLKLDDYLSDNCSSIIADRMLYLLDDPDFEDCETADQCDKRMESYKAWFFKEHQLVCRSV